MPAKRAIILNYDKASQAYRAVLWADVPAGNQIAYTNPNAVSAFPNVTPPELQSIRDGLVAEKVVTYSQPSGAVSIPNAQTWLEGQWAEFQAEVTAETPWANFGAFLNGSGAWQGATGVPLASVNEVTEGLPGYVMHTQVSAFAANKFHFVLWNNAPAATSQKQVIKIRLVVILPHSAVVTGVAPGPFSLQRREAPSTPPSGGNGVTVLSLDSAQTAPSGITAFNAPGVAPAGGTLRVVNQFVPGADEVKPATLDSTTFMSVNPWGGMIVYRSADLPGVRPLTIRPQQTLEIQQDATAGTGNCRVLVIATVG